jgi:single-strand DNA-binding protein
VINKVILVGRLGKDPEGRHLQSGELVVSFSLATDEAYKDRSGEKVQKTEWHSCTVFGKLAEVCEKYLAKGSLVYLEGKLRTESWDKDGQTHYATKIIVRDMKMLGSKGSSQGQNSSGEGGYSPFNGEDDVPF